MPEEGPRPKREGKGEGMKEKLELLILDIDPQNFYDLKMQFDIRLSNVSLSIIRLYVVTNHVCSERNFSG